MTLPSSGAISLNSVAGEFGGSTPHSLSEYYGAASGVPSSGAISLSDFYGKSSIPAMVPTAINFDGTTRASSGLLSNIRSTDVVACNMGEWAVVAYGEKVGPSGVIISKDGTNWESLDNRGVLQIGNLQMNTNMAQDGSSTGVMYIASSDTLFGPGPTTQVSYITPTGSNGKPVLNTYTNMGYTLNIHVDYDEVNGRWMCPKGHAGFYWSSNPASGWNYVARSDGGGGDTSRGYPCGGRPHGQGMMMSISSGRGGTTYKSVSYSGAMGNETTDNNAGSKLALMNAADSKLSGSVYETSNIGVDPVYNNVTPPNHLSVGKWRIGDFWVCHALAAPDYVQSTFFYCKGKVTSSSSWTKQSATLPSRVDTFNKLPIIKVGNELWCIKSDGNNAPIIYTSPFIQ